MQIAAYDPVDALDIVKLWRESFEFGVGIMDPHPMQEQLDFFLSEVAPKHEVTVIKDMGLVVGFMASTTESVGQLYVGVPYLRRGIGSILLGRAKARSGGSLWLHTFARNTNACRFYEHHGFTEVMRESENMYKIEAIMYQWIRSV
jgi:ribosomal protein S18 acetylase RimI-like enzyme